MFLDLSVAVEVVAVASVVVVVRPEAPSAAEDSGRCSNGAERNEDHISYTSVCAEAEDTSLHTDESTPKIVIVVVNVTVSLTRVALSMAEYSSSPSRLGSLRFSLTRP